MTLPHNLQALRARASLSQNDLARLASVDQGLLSHYEAGKRQPSLDTLQRLCEALDCTATELLGW